MGAGIGTIGFDADDTLWHNERFFRWGQARFLELLSPYAEASGLEARLVAAERRNIGQYGFGVKGFTLSMVETALEVTDNKVPGAVIADLLDMGREMLAHPIELLPHAQDAVEALAGSHRVLLITKGDLLHQERKLAQSGLGDRFDAVEIVSDKTEAVYARIFSGHPGGAEAAMMVGNSMKSDVRPAIEAGAWGVFVPQDLAWDFEHAEPPDAPRYHALPDLSGLPDLVAEIG